VHLRDDILLLEGSEHFVDVGGLGGHCKNQLWIATTHALVETHKSNLATVFHQAEFLGKGKYLANPSNETLWRREQ
jgi:hypothetical protein